MSPPHRYTPLRPRSAPQPGSGCSPPAAASGPSSPSSPRHWSADCPSSRLECPLRCSPPGDSHRVISRVSSCQSVHVLNLSVIHSPRSGMWPPCPAWPGNCGQGTRSKAPGWCWSPEPWNTRTCQQSAARVTSLTWPRSACQECTSYTPGPGSCPHIVLEITGCLKKSGA